jgi:ankyrin repeat protein
LLAASRAGWRTVHVLLKKGCDVTLKDINQRNLLHWIIINGGRCEDFAKEMKENSKCCLTSVLNEKDNTGCSPLVKKKLFNVFPFHFLILIFLEFASIMHHAKVRKSRFQFDF